jgi:hypothetical protein
MLKFDWQYTEGLESSPPEWVATFAELRIQHGNTMLSEYHNKELLCIRKDCFVPLYELAEWIARNWWILSEEVKPSNSDFHLRHSIRYSTPGFGLPDIQFFTEGIYLKFICTPYEPISTPIRFIRYESGTAIREEQFRELSRVVESVIDRLLENGIHDSFLQQTWNTIQNPDINELEFDRACATTGFCAAEVTSEYEHLLMKAYDIYGYAELLEVLCGLDRDHSEEELAELIKNAHQTENTYNLPSDIKKKVSRKQIEILPWKIGYALADDLTKYLSIKPGTLAADTLSKVYVSLNLASETKTLTSLKRLPDAIFGTANVTADRLTVVKNEIAPESEYFLSARAVGRLLYDQQLSQFVLSDTTRIQQQISRAFAAQLLLQPGLFKEYLRKGQKLISENSIQTIAQSKGVSEQLVRNHAANHGYYDLKPN